MRGAEHENTPRQDGNFLSRLRVAADALPLLAHAETAEGGYLHLLAPRQGVADLMQHRLDQLGGIAARQTDLPIDRLGKVGAGAGQIGRASCRERGSQYVRLWGGAVS